MHLITGKWLNWILRWVRQAAPSGLWRKSSFCHSEIVYSLLRMSESWLWVKESRWRGWCTSLSELLGVSIARFSNERSGMSLESRIILWPELIFWGKTRNSNEIKASVFPVESFLRVVRRVTGVQHFLVRHRLKSLRHLVARLGWDRTLLFQKCWTWV